MKKILIVDDDPDIRASLSTMLRLKKFEIFTAENSQSAYSRMKEVNPDLILLDVDMTSSKEGLEMALNMHNSEEYKNIPIIIVTGIEIFKGNRTVADMVHEMRNDPDFKEMEVILLKGVDGETAIDFRSTRSGTSESVPVSGFLQKPVNLDQLFEEINKAVS